MMRTTETGWPESATALSSALVQAGLSDRAVKAIAASSRPATMLAATPVAAEDAMPPGATRIGGRPDLPPGMGWPQRPAYADGEAGEGGAVERGVFWTCPE